MTHINAYFADVADAEAKVVQAQGDLEAAKQRLAAKKLEDGLEEPQPEKRGRKPREVVLPPVEPRVPEEESAEEAKK